jgi:4-carboxymuconolactone decarboxylase
LEEIMAAPPSARRDRINPHFPKLVEMTHSYVYGDVWERPQLSKRDRSLVTVAALVALGWEAQLDSHISRALANGVTREEIGELVTHLAMYAGWPAAMTAAHVACDVYEAQDAKG